jgi:hypothetical protein
MKRCEVQGGKSIGILIVNPSPKLVLKRGIILIPFVEGLVVKDIDLELG